MIIASSIYNLALIPLLKYEHCKTCFYGNQPDVIIVGSDEIFTDMVSSRRAPSIISNLNLLEILILCLYRLQTI
jgi:hypothetical protein